MKEQLIEYKTAVLAKEKGLQETLNLIKDGNSKNN